MQRWSEEYKKILYSSRIDTTKKIVKIINQSDKDIYLISTSAIGIYEDNIEQDEDNFTYANSFLSKICQDWESEARESKGKVAIFRFGVILGIGGALKKMLTPFKLGVGGKIADGRQPFFIHTY
jgi:NAD dependent epimerase/dehydratase family enzyme